MREVEVRSDMVVELVDAMGSDASVAQAARVSTVGSNQPSGGNSGLINYLMREHHGSPFEHNALTFYIKAPIFVFREFHRHRIGWSYNERSGRYSKLEPEFYVPDSDRPLVNVGTSSAPEFARGADWQWASTYGSIRRVAEKSWDEYEALIDAGIANEVARAVLPVTIYSEMYATCNARSLMAFLSLRTEDPRAAHHSRPQQEIQYVARQLETHFADRFPITFEAFNKHGRIAP